MTAPSPLLDEHLRHGAVLIPYGSGGSAVQVVAALAAVEIEYAMLRRGAVLLDQPHRGLVEVTGPDRIEFLGRMITQDVRALTPGLVRRSFWLNRKGRIDADLRVMHFEDRTLIDLDIHAAGRTVEGLSSYIVSDDAAIRDITAATHRLALHGPSSLAILEPLVDSVSKGAVAGLEAGRCMLAVVAGIQVAIARDDTAGEVGLEIVCRAEDARGLYDALLTGGGWPGTDGGRGPRIRPAGWHAYNIARIEAGTPIYYIDFGPDSLPAETGVFEDRVSLTKGCYLGQEIVARMHARGHPKQKLVAIKCERQVPLPAPGDSLPPAPRQPETGSHVFDHGSPANVIGAVTSAVTSPMLGQVPVCFAMVRYEQAVAGTSVMVQAGDTTVPGVIQPSLRFFTKH